MQRHYDVDRPPARLSPAWPPPARRPLASQCSHWPNVNERTNQPTNKHDVSQYLIAEKKK